MKKIFSVLLSMILVFSLVACGGQTTTTTTPSAVSDSPSTTADTTADTTVGSDTETTTSATSSEAGEDGHGHGHASIDSFIPSFEEAKSVFGVDAVQSSVIALSWVDSMYLLQAGAPVVALPDNHHIPEETLSASKLFTDHDGNYNFDLIRELKPAVVFASAEAIGKVEGLAAVIEEIGAKVLEIPAATTYEGVLKNVGLLAALFGTEEAAAENIHTLVHRVIDAANLVDESSAKKVAVVTITKDGEFVLGAGDNIQNNLIELAGAENVAAGMNFEGEADKTGNYASPGVQALKDAGAEAFVIMVRIKGDKEAKDAAIAKITEEIKTAYGEDSVMVKNQRFDVIDHHGFIISFPGAINGLENLTDILSR